MSIEREGGFLPPSHFPRCSVTDIFSEVFRQSEYCCISLFYNCTDGAKDWAKAEDTIVRCCPKNPRVKTLQKLALAFNMALAEFLDFGALNEYSFEDEAEK